MEKNEQIEMLKKELEKVCCLKNSFQMLGGKTNISEF